MDTEKTGQLASVGETAGTAVLTTPEAATTDAATSNHAPRTTDTTVQTPKPSRALTADFTRVVLFTGVVIAHSVNAINNTPDLIQSANLVGTLCHLTRYGFVAVTLFVLTISMRGRDMTPTQFWRRRFGTVLWPYLLWTLIYSITDHLIITNNPFPSPGHFLSDLALHTVNGEGKYQLYFLLISMQIYLLFPALRWLMRRAANHPWWTLTIAGAIQMTMWVVFQYLPRPTGDTWNTVYAQGWKTLPMYALFAAIGMLAALHNEALTAWLKTHAVWVAAAAGVGTAFSIGAYILNTSPGNVPPQANTPWNPTSLPWFLGGLALIWLVAMAWNSRRESGRPAATRFVTYATYRAFGVFAIHPLVMDVLARTGFNGLLFEWFPNSAAIRTTVLTAAILALALLTIDVILHTPFSKWLVARPRIPLRPIHLPAMRHKVISTSSISG